MKTKENLIPNTYDAIRKTRTITQLVQNQNLTIFYCKKGID
jgi:hypothetical protein